MDKENAGSRINGVFMRSPGVFEFAVFVFGIRSVI